MLLAAILFGIMAFMVKIISSQLPAGEIVFFRFAIGLIMIPLWMIFRNIKLEPENKWLLALRGIFGGIAISFYFQSVSLIDLSTAVMLSFTYPVFAAIFANFFLKEKLKMAGVFALTTSLIGIYLVLLPEFTQANPGYLYGLLSAIFAGLAVVIIRKLRRADNSWSITLALMIGGTSIGGLLSINNFIMPAPGLILLLIIMGIIATLAQLLLTHGYKYCKVVEGGIISMSTVLISVILAVLFLGEKLSLNFILGGCLIIGSIIILLNSHPGEIIK